MGDGSSAGGGDTSALPVEDAVVLAGDSTRGTRRALTNEDILAESGPSYVSGVDLSDMYDENYFTPEYIEYFKSFGGGFKYVITMRDDWDYYDLTPGDASDLSNKLYGYTGTYGVGEGYLGENRQTMNNVKNSMAAGEYYMYLKRQIIVPISIPRTLTSVAMITEEGISDSGKAKMMGFLDPKDYFKFTSTIDYYGEYGGISEGPLDPKIGGVTGDYVTFIGGASAPRGDITGETAGTEYDDWYTTNYGEDADWDFLGSVFLNANPDGADAVPGSWKSFRNDYYENNKPWWDSHPHGYKGSGPSTSETDVMSGEDIRHALNSSKDLCSWWMTSVTAPNFFGSAGKGKPVWTSVDEQLELTGNSQGGTGTQGVGGGVAPATILVETGSPNYTKAGGYNEGIDGQNCGVIGAFLQSYTGPLANQNMIRIWRQSSYGDDAINARADVGGMSNLMGNSDLTEVTLESDDTGYNRMVNGWAQPSISSDAYTVGSSAMGSDTGDTHSFIASFDYDHDKTGLKIKYGTLTRSRKRTEKFLEFYTGYIYSKIEPETLPREYRTKMQATPKLKKSLSTAVRGTQEMDTLTPTQASVMTPSTTVTMGSAPTMDGSGDGGSY